MATVQTQGSFIKRMNLAVFIPMVLLSLITFVFFIISGLEDAYETKLREVNVLSSLLAISSSSSTGSIIASGQIAQLSYQDRVIQSAKFYPFERIETLPDPETFKILTILTQDSISIQEPVASDVLSNRATGQNANRTLMGYINITLDLSELRQDWLRRHQFRLFGMMLSYILLTWMILTRMKPPLRQLIKLSDAAVNVTDVDIDNINPLIKYELDYAELINIQKLIHDLNYRYKTEHNAYIEFRRHGNQSQANQLNAMQASSFQSMITHELKTSLDAISNSLQLLDNYYISDEQQSVIDTIKKNSSQLQFVLNQIIQLNRIEKGQMSVQTEAFQPIQMINELVDKYQPQAQKHGISIYSHINHIDCILQGDEQKIRSILESLITNALKFTEKGTIKIESNLIYFEHSIRWWVNVIDTGKGIGEKHLKEIFSPFLHVTPALSEGFNDVGISLGLAHKIAQLLDGEILVESLVDKGSKFSLVISLPNDQYAQNHDLLKGVKVVCFTSKDFDKVIAALKSFDAQAIRLGNKQQVLEYIEHNYVNVLAIASDIPYKDVLKLTGQIRESEVSSRLLISYYKNELTQKQIETLQTVGVDICRPVPSDFKTEALLYRGWLGLGT